MGHRIADGEIVKTYTHNQNDTQAMSGQYDPITNKFYMGSFRFGANIYEYDRQPATYEREYDAITGELHKLTIDQHNGDLVQWLLNSKADDNGNAFSNWKIPNYIKEGLEWLRGTLPGLPSMTRLAIESDLRLHDNLTQEVKVVDDELYRRGFTDERLKLLVTLPGVDLVVAQTMLAAFGDITRFRSADKAASYFGLTPRTRQSANKVVHGGISKAGRSHSRGLMIQAAWASTRTLGPLTGLYRKLAKKKCPSVAIVAVARKLVTYAWHMLKNNEPYRYASPGSVSVKLSRIRNRGGGKKLTGERGSPVKPITKDGERIIPPLGRVCEAEGLPPPKDFDDLPEGEQKMLRKKRLVRQTRALERTQRVPVRGRKPHQERAAKEGGTAVAKSC